jgi:phosphoribosyl 1,2-cyclic phosphodiesterase
VETTGTRVLIDAGLSARETEARLATLGRRLDQIQAIVLSHEHDDHARGVEAIAGAQGIPVIATAGTARALRRRIGRAARFIEVRRGGGVRFGDLEVETFPTAHDAAEPVGFRLSSGAATLGHATDLGMVDAPVLDRLAGLQALVLESNHDVDMVKNGPYPRRLKKRILGPYGHLSNDALGEFLRAARIEGLRLLYLAHLSRQNNRPEIARATASLALSERGARARLKLACHDVPSGFEDTEAPLEDEAGRASGAASPRRPEQMRIEFDGSQGGDA